MVPMVRCLAASKKSCCMPCGDYELGLRLIKSNASKGSEAASTGTALWNTTGIFPSGAPPACNLLSGYQQCELLLESVACAATCNPDMGNYVIKYNDGPTITICPAFADQLYAACKDSRFGTISNVADAVVFVSSALVLPLNLVYLSHLNVFPSTSYLVSSRADGVMNNVTDATTFASLSLTGFGAMFGIIAFKAVVANVPVPVTTTHFVNPENSLLSASIFCTFFHPILTPPPPPSFPPSPFLFPLPQTNANCFNGVAPQYIPKTTLCCDPFALDPENNCPIGTVDLTKYTDLLNRPINTTQCMNDTQYPKPIFTLPPSPPVPKASGVARPTLAGALLAIALMMFA
ncbi:unnamed protein product [Closterium sp. NIES-65]|nr:unnamed protein product [Closterium sp. NIES-65]CAI6007507.1 unnamed protein product [Closterium sp. NIES-65]